MWDEATPQIDGLWKQMRPERFHETATAFGHTREPCTTSSCTSSTTKSIIEVRATCTCARSASSRRPSTIEAERGYTPLFPVPQELA